MDVIDVTRQNNVRMKLRDFVEYYNDPCRSKVFNVISLEFTDTGYVNFYTCEIFKLFEILIYFN